MKFNVNPHMGDNFRLLREAVLEGAAEGMTRAMAQVEKDAKSIARWREAGESQHTDNSGNLWEWTTTGMTRDTLTGYALAPGESTALSGGGSQQTTVRINGRDVWTKDHFVDPSLAPTHTAGPMQVLGVLTMYTNYARYVQYQEIAGTVSGIPSPGEMVVVEALSNAVGGYVIQLLVGDAIRKNVAQAQRLMR